MAPSAASDDDTSRPDTVERPPRRRCQRVVLVAVGTCFGQARQAGDGRPFGDAFDVTARGPEPPRSRSFSNGGGASVQTAEPNPLPGGPRILAGTVKRLRPDKAGPHSPQRRPCGPGEPPHGAVLALRAAQIARDAVEPETRDGDDHLRQRTQRRLGRRPRTIPRAAGPQQTRPRHQAAREPPWPRRRPTVRPRRRPAADRR